MLSIFADTPAPAPAPFNLAAYALAEAERQPDKLALTVVSPTGAQRWSFGALAQAVQEIAGGLLGQGLSPRDRVLMRLGNEVDFPLVYLGAIWAGLVPIPASAALTVPEITGIAAETNPALIVAGPGVSLPADPPCPVLSRADLKGPAPAPDLGDPNRPAYIVYTSGTSGSPRGVIHAHRALWARRMMWEGWYGLTPDDRVLHAGAFNWTYTLGTGLLDPWTRGACALIPSAGVTPAQLPLLLKRHAATIFASAPGVYRQMLKQSAKLELPDLRHGLSAGERLPERTRQAWEEATNRPVHEALGMSECSTFISGSPTRPAPQGATGYPQPGRHLAVLDAKGAPTARGTTGILAIHKDDPGLMLGYLGAPEETEARFQGPWFVTGDTVSMAADGAITYLGRDDDMMNAGGYRVSPLEVEAALLTHPEIAEVACAEVPVKEDVTVIAAFYTSPAPLPEERLAAYAEARLARYKCPRLFAWCESLPRSGNGKLDRRALRTRPLAPREAMP